jgi:hypothetical protein
MEWLTVLTCPARREYFAATIASLRWAGSDKFTGEKIVFIDGTTQLSDEDWAWYREAAPGWSFRSTSPDGASIGTKPAMLSLLHQAAEAAVERLVYCEDDILCSKNAIPAILRLKGHDRLAFVSFCDIKNLGFKPGLTEAPGYDFAGPSGQGGHWGNQMLLLSGKALQYLRSTTEMPDWGISIPNLGQDWPKKPEDIALGKKASDIMLGISLALPPAPWAKYGIFTPSLCQHIGERSLVNPVATANGFGRDSLTWPGTDFDALTLNLEDPEHHEAIPHWRADKRTQYAIRFRGGNARRNRATKD